MNCVQCEEAITNPICPACLQEGVQQWLGEERNDILAGEVAVLSIVAFHGDTACIKCSGPMALCTYCYTEDLFNLIKGSPLLLRKYFTYFNFDLEHLGWEREAREILVMNGLPP